MLCKMRPLRHSTRQFTITSGEDGRTCVGFLLALDNDYYNGYYEALTADRKPLGTFRGIKRAANAVADAEAATRSHRTLERQDATQKTCRENAVSEASKPQAPR
jgi:hypothetical protein